MTLILEVSGMSKLPRRRKGYLDSVLERVSAMRLCASVGCSMSMHLLTEQKRPFRAASVIRRRFVSAQEVGQ
jgi:hypothetical protein